MERNNFFTQKQDPRHSGIHGPPGRSGPYPEVSNFMWSGLIPDCSYRSGPVFGLALTDFGPWISANHKLDSKDM